MGMVTIKLKPGVNIENTRVLNEAAVSDSNLIRWRGGLPEKIGGWVRYYPFAVAGVPKAMHAWQDLNAIDRLAIGTTTNLYYVESGALVDITPQTLASDFQPVLSTTASSTTVTITDANISDITNSDSIEFKTPVAIGGLILSGVYPILFNVSTHAYQITAASAAATSQTNATITAITQANPGAVTTSAAHGFSTGQLIYLYGIVGMTQINGTLVTITSTGANSFTIGVNTSAYTAYASAGTASPAAVPFFTTVSGSATVSVTLQAHGLAVGDQVNFPLSTTVGGCTISGTYTVTTISSANIFTISASVQASSTTTAAPVAMNSGQVELLYYIALGPLPASSGYGVGTYGTGGYGTGATPTAQVGTPITATDWSLDNWGEVLLACKHGSVIYYWQPATGYATARPITGNSAPAHNTGMFVSMQTQMLIAYGSTEDLAIGIQVDPLLVKWSAQGDYLDFTASLTSQAGSRRLPTGSKIVAGLSAPQQELLWTDLDLWSMSYLGFPEAWGFTTIGKNCGLIGKHAVTRLGANIYWMGPSNFFVLGGGGVQPVACPVWDAIFQDINTTYQSTSWAWANTPFNEVWFFWPRASTSATNPDACVKLNTLSGEWDFTPGTDSPPLDRSCGIDQSVLGKPISAMSTGLIYQHEMGYDADGVPINAYLETGWFELAEGQDIIFADWLIPDMKFVTYASTGQSAQVQMTLKSAMYPGGSERTYGPFTITSDTEYINLRLRGRLAAIRVESDDAGSWWRMGGNRIRLAQSGRR